MVDTRVQRITRTEWHVDDVVIVRSTGEGRYNVADWMGLDLAGLERLLETLKTVILDILEGSVPNAD